MQINILSKCVLFICLVFNFICFGLEFSEIYEEIEDIYHPTLDDLRFIQSHLLNTERPIVERMKDTAFIAKSFKIIGESPLEIPSMGVIPLNTDPDTRENCVIIYSSFNRNYPKGLKRLVKRIVYSDFKGHIHYRLGGWPNIDEGDLSLCHVPFAFKPCFFKEVEKLGYKRALYIDVSVLPIVSLNEIFEMISETGYFVQDNFHSVGEYMDPYAAESFGLTLQETYEIPSCSAAIIGIDFTNSLAKDLVDKWYQAAKDPVAFFSPRSDQNALSILLWKSDMIDWVPLSLLVSHDRIQSDSLFIMDREFVKNKD